MTMVYVQNIFRFRGYIKALMSSTRSIICNPMQLLVCRASTSRSSLDIGVIPMDKNYMMVELNRRMENYTANRPHTKRSTREENVPSKYMCDKKLSKVKWEK